MQNNTSNNNKISSVVNPSDRNHTEKRKLETVNHQQLNSGSPCTTNISHKIVKLCKESVIFHTDVMKLG